MKSVEFSAELAILLIEGPQDKKSAIDLYYAHFSEEFPGEARTEARLRHYLEWTSAALPGLSKRRFRKPVDLYGLIGALSSLAPTVHELGSLNKREAGERLEGFEAQTREEDPPRHVARYLTAASRQTDNLLPRLTRIGVLEETLRSAAP
jgi:hypothetical protein